jgi:uncharacterized protein YcsI (UPF0317 family)
MIGFDWSLAAVGLKYRLAGAYTTDLPCVPAGRFHGPMVVSARIFLNSRDAVKAIQISSRLLISHGPPIHIGDPAVIGIKDFYNPDVASVGGPIPPLQPGEVVLWWGCGITPQAVAMAAKLPFMITHFPINMFVTDMLAEELAVL